MGRTTQKAAETSTRRRGNPVIGPVLPPFERYNVGPGSLGVKVMPHLAARLTYEGRRPGAWTRSRVQMQHAEQQSRSSPSIRQPRGVTSWQPGRRHRAGAGVIVILRKRERGARRRHRLMVPSGRPSCIARSPAPTPVVRAFRASPTTSARSSAGYRTPVGAFPPAQGLQVRPQSSNRRIRSSIVGLLSSASRCRTFAPDARRGIPNCGLPSFASLSTITNPEKPGFRTIEVR